MKLLKPQVDRVTLGSGAGGGGVGDAYVTLHARPPVTVRKPGTVFAIVVGVSLLAHAAVVWAAFDVPLGRLDPDGLKRAMPTLRVVRAPAYDRVGRDIDGMGEEAAPQLAAEALAQQMLEQTPPPMRDFGEAQLDLRPVDDAAPPLAAETLAVDVSSYELPTDLLAELSGGAPADIEGAGGVSGDGDGRGGNRAGSLAGELLAGGGGGGGIGSGGLGGASGGTRRGIAPDPLLDDLALNDLRPMDTQFELPDLDLTATALDNSTELDVPEQLDNDFDYTLTTFDPLNEPGYFRVDITPRRSLQKMQAMPKDVVFLVDTSSSVPQEWVREVVRGVQESLPTLNRGDRFNIVLFDDTPSFFSTRGMKDATPENLAAARDFLTTARSEGYTDVNAALRQLLVRDIDPKRVYEIVLISDGQPTRGVMSTRDLINLITRDNDLAASIYSIGIGPKQDPALLDFLAYRNKGKGTSITDRKTAAAEIARFLSDLRYPLIRDVKLSVAGLEAGGVFPRDVPNIHQGETFSLYGRFGEAKSFVMQLDGQNAGQKVSFTFTRDLGAARRGDADIAKEWGRWKLHDLYNRILREGDSPQLQAQVEYLRKRYGLKTVY